MSQNPNIRQLLRKYILNQCTPEEMDEVVLYFKEHELSDDFPTVEEVVKMLDTIPEMDESKADSIYDEIVSQKIPKQTVKVKWIWRYASVAAIVLLFIGVGYLYSEDVFTKDDVVNDGAIDQITLQLDDGSTKVISENGDVQITNSTGGVVGKQSGKLLVYENTATSESLVYNTLNVPYGKRFQVQLSDGTTVHLNAGTTIKYPVNFIEGQHRQVYLTGEAFFDVAKDAEHPFIVNSDNLNIRVLGTQFNVSSYPEDSATDVVLVEGSVGMYESGGDFDEAKNTILQPGYKGSFDKGANSITTKQVVTDVYTSWINGGLVFRNMAFKNILKKMERHYNKTIVNENVELSNEIFNASFTDVPIEKILEYLEITYAIDFEINGNQILIN